MFELLFSGLGGYAYTVVHGNRRYGLAGEAAWKRAVASPSALRAAIRFEGP